MREIYKAKDFPILQNRVYDSLEDAINCNQGDINIVINDSGFIFNKDFDSKKMVYDENYNNSVPSNFFKAYYSRIIKHLNSSYNLDSNSLILDIGCGKGTFLKQIYYEGDYSGRAIGIDPSYEGELHPILNKLIFIKEYFNESHIKGIDKISLVLLRHTLEHIPNPIEFLKNIFLVINECNIKNVPIFIEVPDVDWIINNKAYWDFFYEHVNYFSKKSLYETLTASDAKVKSIINEFEGQYLWAEAIINNSNYKVCIDSFNSETNFFLDFNKEIIVNLKRYNNALALNSKIIIWGMASKGIIYSLHLFRNGYEPDFYVDINEEKQNKFIPIIGKKIINPNDLPRGEKLLIICMNPNYSKEINNKCIKLKIDFILYSPNLEKISL